jgi:hypothetical protein
MYHSLGTIDSYMKEHVAELMRDAEHEHLVALATGPGRPVRGRIADYLFAIAERLDGHPRQTVTSAG